VCHVQVHIITSLGIGAHNCRYISAAATYVFKSDSKQLPWSIMKRMFGKDIVQQCLELLDRKRVKQMRVGKVYAPYVHIWDNVMSSSKPFMCVWCFLYCAWGGGGGSIVLIFHGNHLYFLNMTTSHVIVCLVLGVCQVRAMTITCCIEIRAKYYNICASSWVDALL
jgi:hypothetical protein